MANINIPNMKSLTNKLRVPPSGFGAGIGFILGGGILLAAASQSFYNVEGGHAAVVFNRLTGVRQTPVGEGTKLKIPFIERPTIFNVRARPFEVASPTGSKDLQMINIKLRILFKPEISKLPVIYQTLGTNYDERVLPSIVHEVLKSVVAQFNAAQLVTQRERVSGMIRSRLVDRAREFNILLDDVSITHLTFGREYTAAIEAKQVAYQEAERAKFIVEKAEQEKQSIVVRAEGEAESAKMISDAIKSNPNFLTLRKIEASREIANSIARGANRVFLSSDNLLFNILGNDVLSTDSKKNA